MLHYLGMELHKKGYGMLICDSCNDEKLQKENLQFLLSRKVDGILVFAVGMHGKFLHAAKKANVPVVIHLDHGLTFGTVDKALELGFTSVMLDASTLPFEENIARVKAVVEKARKYGATVEAELGLVGGSEDGSCDHGIRCTDPDDAVVYARETGIDALAVAIGNAHGNYPVAPTLAFDVLEKIHERVDIPLVLHGGSGITDKDFQKAISLGIRKVNIATASFNSLTAHVEKYMESTDKHNFFDLNEAMVQGTYENVKKHILVFNEPYQE